MQSKEEKKETFSSSSETCREKQSRKQERKKERRNMGASIYIPFKGELAVDVSNGHT